MHAWVHIMCMQLFSIVGMYVLCIYRVVCWCVAVQSMFDRMCCCVVYTSAGPWLLSQSVFPQCPHPLVCLPDTSSSHCSTLRLHPSTTHLGHSHHLHHLVRHALHMTSARRDLMIVCTLRRRSGNCASIEYTVCITIIISRH